MAVRAAAALAVALGGSFAMACGPRPAREPAAPVESSGSESESAQQFDQRVGWLDGRCLSIANGALTPGTAVTIVTFDAGVPIVQGRIVERTDSPEACAPLRPERREVNASPGRSFYLVDLPASASVEIGVGVFGGAPRIADSVDLDGNGTAEQFTHCTTSEGIAFGAWAGTPYQSTQLWSGYYYLGYDTEANCPS